MTDAGKYVIETTTTTTILPALTLSLTRALPHTHTHALSLSLSVLALSRCVCCLPALGDVVTETQQPKAAYVYVAGLALSL